MIQLLRAPQAPAVVVEGAAHLIVVLRDLAALVVRVQNRIYQHHVFGMVVAVVVEQLLLIHTLLDLKTLAKVLDLVVKVEVVVVVIQILELMLLQVTQAP